MRTLVLSEMLNRMQSPQGPIGWHAPSDWLMCLRPWQQIERLA